MWRIRATPWRELFDRLPDRAREHLGGLPALPVVFGLAGYLGSLSPSLLPRTALFQGVVTGLSTAAWAGLGALVSRGLGRIVRWAGLSLTVRPEVGRALARGWVLLLAVLALGYPFVALTHQRRLASAFDTSPPGWLYLPTAGVVAVAVFAGSLLLWRGLRRGFTSVGRRLQWLPPKVAPVLAAATVSLVALMVVQYLVVGGVLRVVGRAQDAAIDKIPDGVAAPDRPELSGSPGSLESWDDLGYEGRSFVGRSPTAAQIGATTGRPALQPIRAYAAVTSHDTIAGTVAAAMKELDRTRAWERSVLVVHTTTGLGWVNPWSASAVEYLTGGDCASVAIQHSNLPSPLALIDAPTTPQEAGLALTRAVQERLGTLPEGQRPRLFVSGESLGGFGGNAAFASAEDLTHEVDGAVWTGTPRLTPLHQEVTRSRHPGSTELNPVVDSGRHIRFASTPDELVADQFGRDLGPWESPRVVYVQHPSDPVVWWSPELLWSEPDWLREHRADGAEMTWMPIVTFWQVTADLPGATEVPAGSGHSYGPEVVHAWSAVLDLPEAPAPERVVEAIRAER